MGEGWRFVPSFREQRMLSDVSILAKEPVTLGMEPWQPYI